MVQFACWWAPHPTVERDQLDPLALVPFAGLDQLEPLRRSFDHQEAAQTRPAYRFAERLGLPAYHWLSPDLAQDHTSDLFEQGGRKLGTKPAGVARRLRLPPNRHLTLPRPYLSAREAFGIIVPFMEQFEPPWSLTMLSTYGFRQPDGCGIWQARWRDGDGADTVQVVLMQDGRLIFHADTAPASAIHLLLKAMHLPERWIDSTDIAAIEARLPIPFEFARSCQFQSLMTLRSHNDHPHVWEIHTPGDQNGAEGFASWTVYIDAASGEVLAELLGRRVDSQIVPARQRVKNGDWVDLSHLG